MMAHFSLGFGGQISRLGLGANFSLGVGGHISRLGGHRQSFGGHGPEMLPCGAGPANMLSYYIHSNRLFMCVTNSAQREIAKAHRVESTLFTNHEGALLFY